MASENYKAPSVTQSAELAEQQGVNGWDIAEKVRADLDRQSCPDAYMRIAVESVVKHLAATGKQKVGEVQGEDAVGDQLLDELRDVEDYFNDVEPNPIHLATVQAAISALAATGKQQGGEVRGDARAQFEAWALRRGLSLVRDQHYSGRQYYAYNDVELAFEAYQAALAARQPGAQVPVELACVAETLAHGEGLWMTCSGCHESNEGVPTGPYSQIMQCHLGNGCDECGGIGATWDTTDYQQMADGMSKSLAAPPAQGIDLGQFREAVEAQHAALMSSWCGDPETKDAADQQRDRLLALIDQRDAAPGVGNG